MGSLSKPDICGCSRGDESQSSVAVGIRFSLSNGSSNIYLRFE